MVAIVRRGEPKGMKIRCPGEDEIQTTDMVKVPDFDLRANPYLL